jgi:hypothetical protein
MKYLFIALSLAALISGCICADISGITEIIPSKEEKSACPPNYILVGRECCLDLNGNGICDRDETPTEEILQPIETTTTIPQPIETTTSTAPPQTTTTTTIQEITCTMNADCGQIREERICKGLEVYMQRVSPVCRKPGTPSAECIYRTTLVGQTLVSQARPIERCENECRDGICI